MGRRKAPGSAPIHFTPKSVSPLQVALRKKLLIMLVESPKALATPVLCRLCQASASETRSALRALQADGNVQSREGSTPARPFAFGAKRTRRRVILWTATAQARSRAAEVSLGATLTLRGGPSSNVTSE